MGRLRERINRTSDSYYVSGEGYRNARSRMHSNKINLQMNILTIFIGVIMIIGGLQLNLLKLLYWGIGILCFGCLTTWLTYRKRMNE